ncbi:MAG: hypothetical protein MUC49_05270 [Raineya sp.]|jgi:hypothetical protein|nr:hypothetical protein [Raineya sp.]
MKKKIFISSSILFFLPLALTLLQGCIGRGMCSSRDLKPRYFRINSMYLVPMSYNKFYEEQEVDASGIMFWLRTDIDHYTYNYYQTSGFGLMACSPADPQSKESITNIEIYSNNNFEGYPAGTNLAPLLNVEISGWGPRNLVEYLATKPKSQEYFYLYFERNARPTSGNHQIMIIYRESSGKVFEMPVSVNFR